MPRQNYPASIVNAYWRRVLNQLVGVRGVSKEIASVAIKQFRERAKPAGEVIYNVDPERLAEDLWNMIELEKNNLAPQVKERIENQNSPVKAGKLTNTGNNLTRKTTKIMPKPIQPL